MGFKRMKRATHYLIRHLIKFNTYKYNQNSYFYIDSIPIFIEIEKNTIYMRIIIYMGTSNI